MIQHRNQRETYRKRQYLAIKLNINWKIDKEKSKQNTGKLNVLGSFKITKTAIQENLTIQHLLKR